MKKFLFISTLFISLGANSQTWDEWFEQKKTKLKYIEQQIAACQVYAGYLEQGYTIAKDGWTAINDIKHGDFKLHSDYFNSLMQADATITGYPKTSAITVLQLQILSVIQRISRSAGGSADLLPQDKDYINRVTANLLEKCAGNLNELETLTTDGDASLKDDERLKRIDALYSDMEEKYSFAKSFQSSVQLLAISRTKTDNDISTLQLLYGLK